MPRTKRGWLKADALRAGVKEQCAAFVDRHRHEVELRHDHLKGFVVTRRVVGPDGYLVEWQHGTNLPAARERFATEETALHELIEQH